MINPVEPSEIAMLAKDLDAVHLTQLEAVKQMQVEAGVSLREDATDQLKAILVRLELLSTHLEATCQTSIRQDVSELQLEAARQVEQITSRVGLMIVDLRLAVTKQNQIDHQEKLGVAKQMQMDTAHQVHGIGLRLEELARDLGQANELLYQVEQLDQGNGVDGDTG